MDSECFTSSQLQAIANALGDTSEGLSGSEIGHLLEVCGITDSDPTSTKRIRLYNALAGSQNGNRSTVLALVYQAMKPERYLRDPGRYETIRANLNHALMFSGLAVTASGEIKDVEEAQTLSDSTRRADELRADLLSREVHPDVLAFCKAELVAENYFHAVLEATKSIGEKLRSRTGLEEDGSALVDRTLCGKPPMLAINSLKTESERSEQSGFGNLVKGTFGMFRNPTAHHGRAYWTMTKEDAKDLLTLASLIHRRLDKAILLRPNANTQG